MTGDPEVAIGSFAGGVRVGPDVRMPRLPALYRPKRRWKLPEQSDPPDYLEEAVEGDPEWRRNHSTLAELSEQVTAVLEDQAERGQVLKLSEQEARKKYPHLVIERTNQQGCLSKNPVRWVERHSRQSKDTHPASSDRCGS